MTPSSKPPPLSITCGDAIKVRGLDVADQLIGKVTFTEMLLLDLHGELQPSEHVRVIDAVLVAMTEHGLTPSTLAARLVLDSAPESFQGAVAAGLLATGSRFLGVIEQSAALVQEIVAEAGKGDISASAASAVQALADAGQRVPGLGHNLLGNEDPRVRALLAVAERERVAGAHLEALEAVREAAVTVLGKDLFVNAAGAIGAVLSDLGHSAEDVRGFALVARCAGLFAHAVDERRRPIARAIWQRHHETTEAGS